MTAATRVKRPGVVPALVARRRGRLAAGAATPVAASEADQPPDNRGAEVLAAAARLFARRGFDGASMRDIAAEVGLRTSSIYYFFRSKEALFEAIYQQGVQQIIAAVTLRCAAVAAPWERLHAAAAGHLSALLEGGDFAAVVAAAVPRANTPFDARLVVIRDRYEAVFGGIVAALPLPEDIDRRCLRLSLLGSLNAVLHWYRPGGDTPEQIAHKLVTLFQRQLDSRGPA